MKKIVKQIGICVIALVTGITAIAEEKTVQQAPKEFKNPRLNALLTPLSRMAHYMRITPTQLTYYEEDGKTISMMEKDGQLVPLIEKCETIKDEETVAILRCPFENKEWGKAYHFYRFIDSPPTIYGDAKRCSIERNFDISKDKNFDIEAQEMSSRQFLYSTAPGCEYEDYSKKFKKELNKEQ